MHLLEYGLGADQIGETGVGHRNLQRIVQTLPSSRLLQVPLNLHRLAQSQLRQVGDEAIVKPMPLSVCPCFHGL